MPDPITFDAAAQSTQQALDGLALRQGLISRNLANIDTPGYQAQTVNFEDALKASQNRQQTMHLVTTHAQHLTTAQEAALTRLVNRPGGSDRADGNNVDPDIELSDLAETVIRFQALTQLISKKFALLKSITSGR